MSEPVAGQPELRCQWCAEVAAPKSTHCAACGAALPLADSIGAMVIPGVTDIDPDLKIYRDKPLRIPRGSSSQYAAGHAMSAAAADPTGLLALGAFAAVAASEYRNASQGRPGKVIDPDKLGQPSEPVLKLARELQQAQAEGEPNPEAGAGEGENPPAG